jgi:hypothetical protein
MGNPSAKQRRSAEIERVARIRGHLNDRSLYQHDVVHAAAETMALLQPLVSSKTRLLRFYASLLLCMVDG